MPWCPGRGRVRRGVGRSHPLCSGHLGGGGFCLSRARVQPETLLSWCQHQQESPRGGAVNKETLFRADSAMAVQQGGGPVNSVTVQVTAQLRSRRPVRWHGWEGSLGPGGPAARLLPCWAALLLCGLGRNLQRLIFRVSGPAGKSPCLSQGENVFSQRAGS